MVDIRVVEMEAKVPFGPAVRYTNTRFLCNTCGADWEPGFAMAARLEAFRLAEVMSVPRMLARLTFIGVDAYALESRLSLPRGTFDRLLREEDHSAMTLLRLVAARPEVLDFYDTLMGGVEEERRQLNRELEQLIAATRHATEAGDAEAIQALETAHAMATKKILALPARRDPVGIVRDVESGE